MQLSFLQFQPGEAPFMPKQRHRVASQRQAVGQLAQQRRTVLCGGVLLQLCCQPRTMFLQEPFARHQAGTQRQGQPGAAFIHAQLDALGARVADALDVQHASVRQWQRDHVTLHGGGFLGNQAMQRTKHWQMVRRANRKR